MPPNYRQHQDAPLGQHERRGIVVLGAVVLIIGAALGVWEIAGAGGNASAKGPCVSIVIASSTGGGSISYCGSQARTWCATEATGSGPVPAEARTACRRADLLH